MTVQPPSRATARFVRPLLLCALVLVVGFVDAGARPSRVVDPGGGADGPALAPHAPGEVLIKLRPGARTGDRGKVLAGLAAESRRRFASGAERWVLGGGLTTGKAIALYRGDPGVEYIEPNYIVRISRTPDDPRFPELYGLQNTGQTGGTPGADIGATAAWNITTGSRSVVVAVIDTGIDETHADLADNIRVNPGEIPGNDVDDDGNGFVDDVRGWDFRNNDNAPRDDHGHGTHVSGTIGAVGNNGLGVVGVNWRVGILPLKFLGADGSGLTSDAIRAIDYATQAGVDVMSNSWGGGAFSLALQDAIRAAADAEILFVAAAGNDSNDVDRAPIFPASYDVRNIVAVAASDHRDALAFFSNFGAAVVDLGAPGVGILSTAPGGGYVLRSGTSMATPHVAGAAAIIRAVAPGIGVVELKRRLLESVDRVPGLAGRTVTGGRLNVFRAIATPDGAPPGAIVDLAVEGATSNSVLLRFSATGDDADLGTASTYDVRFAPAPFDAAGFAAAARFEPAPLPRPAGAAEALEVTGLEPGTTYFIALRAMDEWSNAGPVSNVVEAATLPAPALRSFPAAFDVDLRSGQTTTLTLTIENAGAGTLDWRVPLLGPAPPEGATGIPGPGAPAAEDFGGPDRFGYRFVDSDEPGGPEFLWEDIAGTGTPIEPLFDDDQVSEPIPLGFEFDFYGLRFDTVRVATNGWLSFTGTSPAFENTPIPGPAAPENLIAPFWDDLHFRGAHRAAYRRDGGSFTVQFTDLPRFDGPGSYTFQVSLRDTGEILFRYLSMTGTTTSSTVGIQNASRTDGLQVAFDTAYVHDRLAVRITSLPQWLTAAPRSGRLLSGERREVVLTIDATGLGGGLYEDAAFVQTNDPLRPLAAHPVALWVTDAPAVALDPPALDFGTVFIGAPRALPLTVRNTGTVPLSVSGIETGDPAVTVDPAALDVPPGSAAGIAVTYAPTEAGPLDATLVVTSDASNPAQAAVRLRGAGAPPPRIAAAPAAFAETLFAGSRLARSLAIRNDGGSDLVLSLSVRSQGGWLRVAPEGLTVPPGESRDVAVTLDAADLVASVQAGTVRIDTNVPAEPVVRIAVALTVVGAPAIAVGGPEMALGSTVDYTTGGARTAHRLEIPVAPGDGGVLELIASGDYGLSSEIATLFAEGAALGTVGATGTDCVAATLRVPLDAARLAALLGDGLADLEVRNSTAVEPICPVNRHTVRLTYPGSATRLVFGAPYAGLGRDLALRLRNVGSEVLKVTSIRSDSAAFTPAPAALTIAPRASQAVAIRFTATTAGPFEGTLRVLSDDPGMPLVAVSLAGTGVGTPRVEAEPPALPERLPEAGRAVRPVMLNNMEEFPVDFLAQVRGRPALGAPPGACAIASILVTEFNGGALSRVDPATGLVTRIAGGLVGPRAVAVDPGQTKAYVVESVGRMSAVDLATGSVTRVASGFNGPFDVVLDRSGARAFVTEFTAGRLAAVDLATGTVTAVAGALEGPMGAALNAAGTLLHVARPDDGEIETIDLATLARRRVASSLGRPLQLALEATETRLFVTGSGTLGLVAVDLVTGAVTPLATGLGDPSDIVLDPGGATAYVTDFASGRLLSVDLGSGAVNEVGSGLTNPSGAALVAPPGCQGRFLTLEPAAGSIPAGGSVVIEARIDAGTLPPGAHGAEIAVSTARPLVPLLAVPVTLEVASVPNIAIQGQEVSLESARSFVTAAARTDHQLPATVPRVGGGTLELTVSGDFGALEERATVSAEGVVLGTLGNTGADCQPASAIFPLSAARLAALAEDGVVEVAVENSPDVGPFCAVSLHRVRLRYANADPAAGLDLGAFFVGLSREVGISVRNTGSSPLEVGPIVSDRAEFSASPPVFGVPPGSARTLSVRFTPRLPGRVGGVLGVASNDPDSPRLSIAVTGTGLGPPVVAIDPGALAVTLPEEGAEPRVLTLRNGGESPLDFSLGARGRSPGPAPSSACRGAKIYVVESGVGSLVVAEPATGATTRVASGLSGASGLAISPAGRTAYVAENGGGGRLRSIDLNSGAVSTVVSGLGGTVGVAVNRAATIAMVTGAAGDLTEVDLLQRSTRRVASRLSFPQGLALDPGGITAFVTEADVGALSRVHRLTGAVTRVASGLAFPTAVALRASGASAYVTEGVGGTLATVNLVTGAVTRVASGLEFPRGLTLDRSETVAYVSEATGTLAAIDLASGTVLRLAEGLFDPIGVALTSPIGCAGEFLLAAPAAGAVAPHGARQVEVRIDAAGLSPGVYAAAIDLSSNDPLRPSLTVPVTLTVAPDGDRDGVEDGRDNCPAEPNADQRDADADGVGEVCDNCPGAANPGQADFNDDGSGDACQPMLLLTGIRQDGGEGLEVRARALDPQGEALHGTLEVLAGGATVMTTPFVAGLPRRSPLTGLVAGVAYRLVITVTDGATEPVRAEAGFLYSGESLLLINHPPLAAIGAPAPAECDRAEGGAVSLDGRGAADIDSTPGTGDDIVSFEWIEDPGGPQERRLGSGPALQAVLPLGERRVALRVTDTAGESDTAVALVTVRDTIAPALVLVARPLLLWPPNHKHVRIGIDWQAEDACDPRLRVALVSVVSSEPDDAPGDGDGRTVGDIAGAAFGTPDREVRLRAERAEGGPGRTYEITYMARDASGNAAPAVLRITVPPDKGSGTGAAPDGTGAPGRP